MSSPPHEPKKPKLQDYRITPEQYAMYFGRGKGQILISHRPHRIDGSPLAVVVVFLSAVSSSERDMRVVLHFLVLSVILGWLLVSVAGLVEPAILRFKRSRVLKNPVASRIKLYEEAMASYQAVQAEANAERARQAEAARVQREAERARRTEAERARQEAERARRAEAVRAQREAERTQRTAERARQEAERVRQKTEMARRRKLAEHWISLSGPEFEQELGMLFRQDGYLVEQTPSSGDQGVDLILRKDGQVTVVQCKSHRNPVGPAVARELYGSLLHFGADSAILACTGGFTQGVKDFVRGKPIVLISALDLVSMGEPLLGGSVMDRILEPEQPTLPIESNTQRIRDGEEVST